MKLYGTEKAAEYLGMSLAALKYHIYVAHNISPHQKIGKALVFTQEQLNEFQSTRRGPGRPPKQEEPNK